MTHAPLPPDPPSAPEAVLPRGACDAHIHMLGQDFTPWEGRVEDPGPGNLSDWVARFQRHQAALGLERAVVVHSILYGGDNAVTLAAVDALGRDRARGICLVRDDVSDAVLDDLADAGAVGVRLNYVHGGILTWEGVQALAPRLAARGLHVQMLLHTHRHMDEIAAAVRALPVPVCFDHLGWPDLSLGVAEPGYQTLLGLLADGACWLKLSGVYRLGADWALADPFVDAALDANPEQLVWGSDWPHIMLADAAPPDGGALLRHILARIPDAARRQRVFVDNPATLYGFAPG